jgi:small GTP-binding protein
MGRGMPKRVKANVPARQPPESAPVDFRIKVCLLGEEGVGKTSLVARFVLNQFSERYARSLGARMLKKEFTVTVPGGSANVVLLIWDVMGEKSLRDILKEAYFGGSQGILAVADLTRPETIQAVPDWIDAAQSVAGRVPVTLLGNKIDLHPSPESIESFEALAEEISAPRWLTSAKTGQNVEAAFQSAAAAILAKTKPPAVPAL